MKFREVRDFAQSHATRKEWNQDLSPALLVPKSHSAFLEPPRASLRSSSHLSSQTECLCVFLFKLKLLWLEAANHSKTRDSYSLRSEPQVFPGWLCQLFSFNCFWGRGKLHINGIPKKNVMVTKQGESSDNGRKCWKIPFHLLTAVWVCTHPPLGTDSKSKGSPRRAAHILWVHSYSSFRFLKIFF